MDAPPPPKRIRWVALVAGATLVLPVALLWGIGLAAPVSGWGLAFLTGLLVASIGLLTAPWRARRWRWWTRGSALVLLAILILRCAVVRGDRAVRMVTLPEGTPAGSAGGIVPERDLALGGSRLLELRGFVPRGFVAKLRAAYDRLGEEAGELPTPLTATYLGLQRPDAFDTVIVEPTGDGCRRRDTALVFLHGYAGNVALICWLVAGAAREHGAATYCPSVGFAGDWWSTSGARTLAATLSHLRARGVRRVFLAGLSNGGRGASVLAPRFRREVAGVMLISGLSRRAGPPGMPLLLVHGRADPGVPAGVARRYLQRAGSRATHVTIAGDHFVLLTREQRVRQAIARWLGRQLPVCR